MPNNHLALISQPPQTIRNRNNVFDFLRGLAILGVLSVHSAQDFSTSFSTLDGILGLGRFGVQLFYFASALTMCYMWARRENESRQVLKFYIRRFLRIAPLFWLAMIFYLHLDGTGSNYWAPEGISRTTILLTAAFANGFWPDAINSVVPGGWSIAVEMVFYLVFPLLIIKIKNPIHYLYLSILFYFSNLLIIEPTYQLVFNNFYHTVSNTIVKDFFYLYIFNQIPAFLLGIFIYKAINDECKNIGVYKPIIIVVIWVISASALALISNDIKSFGFLLVILSGLALVTLALKYKPRHKLIEGLGRKSYVIYLGHPAIMSFVAWLFNLSSVGKVGISIFILGFVTTLVLSYIFAEAAYFLIEKRIQLLTSRIIKLI